MKKYIFSLALVAMLGFSACDDSLNLDPKDRVSESDYFNTETDLQMFTNPFYNNLLKDEIYKKQSDVYVRRDLSTEMRGGSDRVMPKKGGGGWSWTDLRRMNTLLARADKCPDEAAVTKYKAVTRFFRAYFYFDKVVRFGDVPWYDVELGSSDAALYNARDSRELIMTHMIEDIDFAIANLPEKNAEKSVPYRVTKYAAMALKSRFCLFEGTYRKYHGLNIEGHDYKYYLDQAAAAAKTLIESGQYKLYTTGNPNSDYINLFAAENANMDEYILAIKYDYAMDIRHNATAHATMPTQGSPGLTRKMVNTYLMKDGTRFTDKVGWQEMFFTEETMNRDPRLAQTIRTPGYKRIGQTEVSAPDLSSSVTGYQIAKFVQNPSDYSNQVGRPDMSACDLPVFRYAEVLLNYAEAKAENGTLTQQDLDISINELRDRVGMPHLFMSYANSNPDAYMASEETGFANVSGDNKGVILEVRRERAVELAIEGFRWNDLMRWKAGPCINQPITGMYFPGPGEYDLSGDGVADVILYAEGTARPDAPAGVSVFEINKDIKLTGGNKGYLNAHRDVVRTPFNEGRDYLYPIPPAERSLNKNLTQNPGWNDGLNF